MKSRLFLGLMASVVCSHVAAQGTVTYQTQARPLPSILADVGAMLSKKIVCSKAMESDRLFIRVTDVDPEELLEKIRAAVCGRLVDRGTFLLIEPDPEFDRRFLTRRDALIDEWHAEWKESLDSPVRVSKVDLDMSALAEFVSPDRLKRLGIEEYVWFSRPRLYTSETLPSSVADYHKLVPSSSRVYTSTTVSIQSTRSGITVRLLFQDDEKVDYSVHFKYLSLSSNIDRGDLFTSTTYFPEGALGERLRFVSPFKYNNNFRYMSVRPLGELALFEPKYWGNEPLNAFASPYLNAFMSESEKDIVAYLDDEAANPPSSFNLSSASFLTNTFIDQKGDWIVAQSNDPTGARSRRGDRGKLATYLKNIESDGFIDFWSYVEYLEQPGSFSEGVIQVESAALGILPLACVTGMRGVRNANVFQSLKREPRAWQLLQGGTEVLISSLSPQSRKALEQFVRDMFVFTVSVQKSEMIDGVARVRNESKRMNVQELGVERGFPKDATITVRVSRRHNLLGKNSERDYVLSTQLTSMATAIAYVEAGLGSASRDSLFALKSFVPYDDVTMHLSFKIGNMSFNGALLQYLEMSYGVDWLSLGDLPQPLLDEFNKALAQARKIGKQAMRGVAEVDGAYGSRSPLIFNAMACLILAPGVVLGQSISVRAEVQPVTNPVETTGNSSVMT